MSTMTNLVRALPLVGVGLALAASVVTPASAEGDEADKAARCATRLSITILGESPSDALVAKKNPQAEVDAMLSSEAFVERFARFANQRFNPEPGENVAEDASYTLAKHVLGNDLPWKDMFVGRFRVTNTVTDDPEGLGYFRSPAWMRRYAGNEEEGYRIVGAYRILQNTTGLEILATTNVDGADLTATGRQAPACKSCHYDNWYALDKVAKVLSRRSGPDNNITYVPPSEGPQEILGGKTIANDEELLTALVESENYRVNACRLAFSFLYGRAENACESAVFDRCMEAFGKDGRMQSALSAIAKDASFCQ
jgi:hypothetical protein